MMMAQDPTPGSSGELSGETVDALRAALVRYMRKPEPSPDLHESLIALAREARRKNIHAEQLLITLKELWNVLPEVKSARNPREQNTMLQQLVTLCIQEYYAG
jgi:hypothetical protein